MKMATSKYRTWCGRSHRGLTLVELLFAFFILSLVIVPIGSAMANATVTYTNSRENMDGHWIANVILNKLASEKLPSYGDQMQSQAKLSGEGTFREVIQDLYSDASGFSERELAEFELWHFTWGKELIAMNSKGRYASKEDGTGPDFGEDNYNSSRTSTSDNPLDKPDDPAVLKAMPAARVIRVRLELNIPQRPIGDAEYDDEDIEPVEYEKGDFRGTEAGSPTKIIMVTFVDTDDLKEDVEDKDPATAARTPTPTTPPPPPPPSGNGN